MGSVMGHFDYWHLQRVTEIASYLKAVLEFPADKVESHRIDAGVQRGHVDAKVIHDQEETGRREERIEDF